MPIGFHSSLLIKYGAHLVPIKLTNLKILSVHLIYIIYEHKTSLPRETREEMANIGGYSISPKVRVHSTFRTFPMSSCFGQKI